MLRSYVWRAEDWCTTAPVHDVATFLVRRDHRLARELRDMLQAEVPVGSQSELGEVGWDGVEAPGALTQQGRASRLAQLKVALDAALADWVGETGRHRAVTSVSSLGISGEEGANATGRFDRSALRPSRDSQ